MKEINILWTGGLDSTYRVSELSRMDNLKIIPYYLKLEERKSYKCEIKAIHQITEILRNHPLTKAEISDLIIIDECKIYPDNVISGARQKLTKQYKLGSQYDYIARFLNQYNIKAEVGVLFADRGKVTYCIGTSPNRLVKIKGDVYNYYMINPDEVSEESALVFGNMIFPESLINKTKVEEREDLEKMGLKDVFVKTWFCHQPILGLPCGLCNPCKDALNEGMEYRVPKLGIILGKTRWYYRKWGIKTKRVVKDLFRIKG